MKLQLLPVLAALLLAAPAFAQTASVRRDVGPNTSPTYEKECGGCHFPYQPGWLPERSWRKLMSSLREHFGENATLKPELHDAVQAYLVQGSADQGRSERSREILQAIPKDATPLSITQVLYVGGIHGGFLDPAFRGEPQVKTLAQCSTCHQKAARGWFVPVTYTITDEAFRSNDVDYSASIPVPAFLRLKK
jgi:hypothetical protein